MMTRNEWIAETARDFDVHGRRGVDVRLTYGLFTEALDDAIDCANELEAANVAPWNTPAPALSDTAAKVVEAAVEWSDAYDRLEDGSQLISRANLHAAVRAHRAATQGGAS